MHYRMRSWTETHLLSYQLRVYAGFPRRSSFTDVTHEALKCFRSIPISADTTVPVIFFQNLRLAFSASRMVHCLLKSIVERCTVPKESLPSSEAMTSLNLAIFRILDILWQSQTKVNNKSAKPVTEKDVFRTSTKRDTQQSVILDRFVFSTYVSVLYHSDITHFLSVDL